MRTIGVVTVSRSDYGIYLPILRKIQEDAELKLHLIVGGMHMSPAFGLTVKAIETDGFEIAERVEMLLSSDTPEGTAKSIGLGVIGFAQSYARFRPDMLVVLGDRFDMYAAAVAALPFKIPVAHIHGGEITQGVIDDALRHSITKLSHLHFVATEEYANRVMQMGEESWRVMVSGAPGLDNLKNIQLLSRQEVEALLGIRLDKAPLLVTYHPVTLEYEQTERQVEELLKALALFELPMIFTFPNADMGGRVTLNMIESFVKERTGACLIDNLGTQGYFSVVALAAAMVGNSSSGIVEAASFKLPVVNIGSRQRGRIRGKNVLDVGYSHAEIHAAITKAISPEFHSELHDLMNVYGNGSAAEMIVEKVKETKLSDDLLVKVFCDRAWPA